MNVNLVVQKDGVNTLKEEFLNKSNKDLKKIFIVSGTMKETGFEVIDECLIDSKARKLVLLGIDKKYTTRKILEGLYKHTKNVYIYNNNNLIEMYSNIYIFEFETEAFIYLINGNVSESSLFDDINYYTSIQYDLNNSDDKASYTEYVTTLTKEIKNSDYVKLTEEVINNLVISKDIFTTKQYIHSIPSISDLIGKEKEDNKNPDNIVLSNTDIPKVKINLLDDDPFEIDLGDIEDSSISYEEKNKENIKLKANKLDRKKAIIEEDLKDEYELDIVNEEDGDDETYVDDGSVIDMENLLFEQATVKVDKKSIAINNEKIKEDKPMPTSKKIDLSKVSNLIIELPKKATKGKEVSLIKIPNYIKDMIPDFFDSMENGTSVVREDGTFKESGIILEIIDINENKKHIDKEAKLSWKVGQTYISFSSEKLKEVSFEQDDIARIIKLSSNSYHIEIVPKETEEYSLWKKLCTQSVRGSNRLFGMM